MCIALSVPVVPTVDLVALFDRCRERANGMKHETLAALMGIPANQLSMALRNHGHASFNRLLMLLRDTDGRLFLAALGDELLTLAGVDDGDPVTYLRRAMALLLQKQMARVIPHAADERKRA